ncbi:MAG: hypothetical protein QF569_25500 [Candidatus Poribacteria bacterium]|nr:hypothetical protein [Candidatus Poribacteria bacterium]
MRITSSEWILHPEGIFRGRITAIEPTNRFVEGMPEKTFVIETVPIDAEGPTRSIRYTIYCIESDSSRFSMMCTAISGKELNIDRGVNTDELIGGQAAVAVAVTVTVQHSTKDNGRKGHRITHWWPHKKC